MERAAGRHPKRTQPHLRGRFDARHGLLHGALESRNGRRRMGRSERGVGQRHRRLPLYVRSQQRRIAPRAHPRQRRGRRAGDRPHAGRRGHRTDAGARRNRIRVRASAARTRPDRRYDQHDAGARMHPHHGNRRHRRGESRRSRLAEGDPARKRRRGEHRAGLRNRPQRRQQRPQGGDPARNPRCRRQDPRPSRSLRRPDHRQCDGRFQGRRDDRIRSGRPAQPQRTADGQLRRRSGALLLRHRIRPRRHAVDHGRDLQRIGRIVRRCREHGRPAPFGQSEDHLQGHRRGVQLDAPADAGGQAALDRRPARHDPRSGRRSGADGREDALGRSHQRRRQLQHGDQPQPDGHLDRLLGQREDRLHREPRRSVRPAHRHQTSGRQHPETLQLGTALDQWAEAGQGVEPRTLYAHGFHQRTCPQPERRNGRRPPEEGEAHFGAYRCRHLHLCDAQGVRIHAQRRRLHQCSRRLLLQDRPQHAGRA